MSKPWVYFGKPVKQYRMKSGWLRKSFLAPPQFLSGWYIDGLQISANSRIFFYFILKSEINFCVPAKGRESDFSSGLKRNTSFPVKSTLAEEVKNLNPNQQSPHHIELYPWVGWLKITRKKKWKKVGCLKNNPKTGMLVALGISE